MLQCSQSLFVCRVLLQGHASRFIYGPVHEILVLLHAKREMKMKVQAKIYRTAHETFVFIAYASSKGSDESTHLRSVTTAFAARIERMKRCR